MLVLDCARGERATFGVVVAGHKSRKNPRAHVALVARYRSPTAFEFVEEQCSDLSSGGMFIRSPVPAPTGTLLKLECDVDDGQGLIRAVARVVWVRERDTSEEPRGMGVKFVKLEPGGRELIAAVLESVGGDEGAGVQARISTVPPPRDSASEVVSGVSVVTRAVADGPRDDAAAASAVVEPPVGGLTPSQAALSQSIGRERERALEQGSGDRHTIPEPFAADVAAKIAAEDRASQQPQSASTSTAAATAVTATAATTPATATPATTTTTSSTASPKPESTSTASSIAKPVATAVTTVTPVTDTKRSGVPTHRPSAKRGVDMQAFAVGAALLIIVALLALMGRGSERREEAAAPITRSQPAPAPSAPREPVLTPAAAHVLQLTTLPDAARITIGDRVAQSPVTLELGALTKAVEVRAEKEGFEPVTTAIELGRFNPEGDKRVAHVMLALPPLPSTSAQTEPAATAAPIAPAPALPSPAPVVAAAAPVVAPAAEPAPVAKPKAPRAARKPALAEKAQPIDAPAPEIAATTPAATAAPAPATTAPAAAPAAVAAAPVVAAPAAAPAPAPAAAPAPVAAPAAKLSPLETAIECLGRGDNACVVSALEGKANSPREMEILIETYRATGRSEAAARTMRTYIERFPGERRAAAYAKQLE